MAGIRNMSMESQKETLVARWVPTRMKMVGGAGEADVLIELAEHSTVELIKTNASDVDVAYAAWVSNFGSAARERDTSNIGKLIDFLYSNLHMSPFEHGSYTL